MSASERKKPETNGIVDNDDDDDDDICKVRDTYSAYAAGLTDAALA